MFKSKTILAGMNAKTIKGDKSSDYVTAIMYLAPADIVSGVNLCPMAELAGCKKACLFTAGRGGMSNVQKARVRKSMWFRDDRQGFIDHLKADIARFVRYCEKRGKKAAVRLNGTSDIQWEVIAPSIFTDFPMVQFYDYTKIAKRMRRELPSNYSLVLSYSAANRDYAQSVIDTHLDTGCNVAVVYRTKEERDMAVGTGADGWRVIDGDKTDLRFLDPQGVIVGLYAKGAAKHDRTGFVVDCAPWQPRH